MGSKVSEVLVLLEESLEISVTVEEINIYNKPILTASSPFACESSKRSKSCACMDRTGCAC